MSTVGRPTGVTILGVLGIVVSMLGLLLGLAIAVFGVALLPGIGEDLGGFFGFIGGLLGVIGIVIVFFSVVGLVVSWGLLSRKYWAWLIMLILQALSVIGSLGTALSAPFMALPGLLVSGIIIYYLLQPHVKAWFEHKPPPAETYPPPPPSYA